MDRKINNSSAYFRLILTGMFLLCICFTSLAQLKNRYKFMDENIKTDSLNIPVDESNYYLPLSLFYLSGERNRKLSVHLNRWYSLMLYALKEPLLYNKPEQNEVYRLTWLRRFRNPVAVRIEKKGESIKLYVKVSDGQGGANPGKLVIDKSKDLTIEQWNTFKIKLTKARFWSMPVEDFSDVGEGSERILEGSTGDSYHFVTRSTPYEYKWMIYRECCDYMLQLSELNLTERAK